MKEFCTLYVYTVSVYSKAKAKAKVMKVRKSGFYEPVCISKKRICRYEYS